jgi:hypothetical protein
LLDSFVVETRDYGVTCDAAEGVTGYVCWGEVLAKEKGREGGREKGDKLSPGGGGVMNVGVGVPWGGRAAETCAVKAMVAQRMKVVNCMAAVRLEEVAMSLDVEDRKWE